MSFCSLENCSACQTWLFPTLVLLLQSMYSGRFPHSQPPRLLWSRQLNSTETAKETTFPYLLMGLLFLKAQVHTRIAKAMCEGAEAFLIAKRLWSLSKGLCFLFLHRTIVTHSLRKSPACPPGGSNLRKNSISPKRFMTLCAFGKVKAQSVCDCKMLFYKSKFHPRGSNLCSAPPTSGPSPNLSRSH